MRLYRTHSGGQCEYEVTQTTHLVVRYRLSKKKHDVSQTVKRRDVSENMASNLVIHCVCLRLEAFANLEQLLAPTVAPLVPALGLLPELAALDRRTDGVR